jgi:hypothetical protein
MNNPQIQTIFEGKEDHAEVRQDKRPPRRSNERLEQPYTANPSVEDRPKHHGSESRQTAVISARAPFDIKARITAMAQAQGLSESAVVMALVKKALQAESDMQYGAMLRPVIEDSVKREIDARIDRTNQLAMNAFLAGEQGRVLTIHVLSLLLNGGGDALPQLVKDSQKQAWANLRYLMKHTEGGEN